jgi:hypothetical protein
MIKPSRAMSNGERQHRFRARNPGYNRRYRYRENPEQTRLAILQALAAAEAAEVQTNPPAAPAIYEVLDFVI